MDDDLRPRRLLTSPLGLTAAALLVLSVALEVLLDDDYRWFMKDGSYVARGSLQEIGVRLRDGTVPSFTAPFIVIYPAAMIFSSWFVALAGWPVRLWSRIVTAVLLLALAAIIVVQAQDRAPGPESTQLEAYLIIGTGLVTAAALGGIASMMFRSPRWVRCLLAAGVPLVHAIGLAIGLVQLLDAQPGLSLGVGPYAFMGSLLLASASLLVLAVATKRRDAQPA